MKNYDQTGLAEIGREYFIERLESMEQDELITLILEKTSYQTFIHLGEEKLELEEEK